MCLATCRLSREYWRMGGANLSYRLGVTYSSKMVRLMAVSPLLTSSWTSRVCRRVSTIVTSLSAIFFVSPTCLGLRGNAAAVMLLVSGLAVTEIGGTFTSVAAVVIPVCTSLVVSISAVRRQCMNFFLFHLWHAHELSLWLWLGLVPVLGRKFPSAPFF